MSILRRFKHTVNAALMLFAAMAGAKSAWALPAFAIREGVSCTVCHSNGSAPHLTEVGYLYRRAGFRFPSNIGNKEVDAANMDLLKHFVAGLNIDYELATAYKSGSSPEAVVSNDFNVREAELWPVVGSFFGNFAVWSELDMVPSTATIDPATNTTNGNNAAVELSQADLRYVWGDQNFFYSIRAGLMAPEGYGASDQFLDDGSLPIMESLSAIHAPGTANELDTLAIPLGAMETPQVGFEFGINWPKKFLTLGMYNGFDGTNGLAKTPIGQSDMTPALMQAQGRASKDFKVQYDQFVNEKFAYTAVYYNGRISLLDPSNGVAWLDSYQMGRLYGTFFAQPNKLDLLAGAGYGEYGYVVSGSNKKDGDFHNMGAFVGANYYVRPHLTLSAHADYYEYDSTAAEVPVATGVSLFASLPYENNIWVFHLVHTEDDLNGRTNDFRAEWRFLY